MRQDTLAISGGRQLRFVQAGSGPDVVLIHGTLMTLEDMVLALGERLAPRFRVTAFDRPGHGHSTRGRLQGSLAEQAACLREGLRALGIGRPVLVGHSSGAAVALTYALRFPGEVAGVTALAPIVVPEPRLEQILFGPRAVPVWGDMLAAGLGPLLDRVLAPVLWRAVFLPQAMPARFAALFPFALAGQPRQMLATGEDALQMTPDLLWNLAGYSALAVPLAVVVGSRDIVVNPGHGRLLARLVPGARFTLVPGVGHMVHHAAPEPVVAAIDTVADRELDAPRPLLERPGVLTGASPPP